MPPLTGKHIARFRQQWRRQTDGAAPDRGPPQPRRVAPSRPSPLYGAINLDTAAHTAALCPHPGNQPP